MTAQDLKARRTALDMTQARLAASLGVQLTTYCNWEQGIRKPPALLDLAMAQLEARDEKKP